MAPAPQPRANPTRDAASLLRRLGFVVLLLGLPLAALLSRRGPVTLVPVGVILLVLPALLDGAVRPLRSVAAALSSSSGVVALALALMWAAVSLLWTPTPAAAAERLVAILGILGIVFAGYLVLPDRMRAANLYLIPVGAASAAAAMIAIVLLVGETRPDFDGNGRSLGRGAGVLILALWPSIAWLRSRERDLEALTLAVLVATATLMAAATTPLPVALGAGALAYAVATVAPRSAAILCAVALVAALGSPALLPYAGADLLGPLAARSPGVAAALQAWSAEVRSDPIRLITGHGFSALLGARRDGSVSAAMPSAVPVQLWYDLGLVGILAIAAAFWCGLRAAVVSYAPLLPGVLAAYATAFVLACFGVGIGQTWWVSSLALTGLAFVAAERGQFKTRRPRALLFGPARNRA